MNQCPHNLDMWQWLFGMPDRVRASCYYGKHHNIEVEDEVVAQMEYGNGAIGTFIVSTGEAPGWNRLEIFGNNGCVLLEGGKIRFQRTEQPVDEHLANWQAEFDKPQVWDCDVEVRSGGDGHVSVLKEFTQAITNDGDLTARGEDGINGLMLANAMLLSSWLGDTWVDLPVDEDLYFEKLQERIAASDYIKPEVVKPTGTDFEKSKN
jgi:predicted dehydrogenase